VLLTVKGYVNSEKIGMSENEVAKQIKDRVKARCAEEPHLEFSDVHAILEDDLLRSFMSKLERRNYDEETKKQLRDLAIRAMMEVRA
jgi:hypothetical protein